MIAAAMIVGPGESLRYLDRTLRLADTWADQVIAVLDITADRDTIEAVRYYDDRAPLVEQQFTVDESAVRNQLCARLDRDLQDGDVVVVLDADEELASTSTMGVRNTIVTLVADPAHGVWPVTFHHLWHPSGREQRVDGGWRPAEQPRVYRHQVGARLPARALACGHVPLLPDGVSPMGRVALHSPLFIRHWGYARPHDRIDKHARYQHIDGGRFHSGAHLDSILAEHPTLEAAP